MPKDRPPKDLRAHQNEEYEGFEHCSAGSYTECTGLIATPPQNEEELESYMDIFDFAPPNVADRGEENDEKNAEESIK